MVTLQKAQLLRHQDRPHHQDVKQVLVLAHVRELVARAALVVNEGMIVVYGDYQIRCEEALTANSI